jgi:GNAT superfamily N-acetyltransferase
VNAAFKPLPVYAAYAREQISDVVNEIKPLLEAHYHEIAHYPDIALKPDYQRYVQAEGTGILRIFTARVDGALIGYGIYFVHPSMQYSDSLQAQQHLLFVHPDYRKGSVGRRLIHFGDEQLRAEGVQVVIQHTKARADLNLGPLLERMGYELMDHIYVKRLD